MTSKSHIGLGVSLPSTCLLYVSFVFLFLGPLQTFDYQPAYIASPNEFKIALGLFISLIVALVLPTEKQSPIAVFLWLLFLLMILPRIVLTGCRNLPIMYILCTLFAFLLVVGIAKIMKPRPVPRLFKLDTTAVKARNVAIGIFGILAVVLTCYLVLFEGFPGFGAFSSDLVYEIRAEASNSTLVSVSLSLFSSFIGPLVLIYCFVYRRVALAILVTLWLIFLFLYVAMKTWLLVLALLWFLFLLNNFKKLHLGSMLLLFTLFFVVLAVSYCFVPEDSELQLEVFSLFFRRLIMVPAVLGYEYFDFFLNHETILLQNTIFSFVTPMPNEYQVFDYQNLIALSAFGTSEMWANTGLFGSEYAQFGLPSVFIIIANLALLIYLLKRDGGFKVSEFLLYSAVLIPFLLLNSSTVRFLFSYTGIIGIVFFVILLTSFVRYHESMIDRH